MADTTFPFIDGLDNLQERAVRQNDDNSLTPYGLEDAAQRAALLAALGAIPYVATLVTLSTTQATGADPVLAANAVRRGYKIQAPARFSYGNTSDVTLALAAFANVPNGDAGPACDNGPVHLFGLPAGTQVVVWEG